MAEQSKMLSGCTVTGARNLRVSTPRTHWYFILLIYHSFQKLRLQFKVKKYAKKTAKQHWNATLQHFIFRLNCWSRLVQHSKEPGESSVQILNSYMLDRSCFSVLGH